jgi:hypothetical protein
MELLPKRRGRLSAIRKLGVGDEAAGPTSGCAVNRFLIG